MGDSWNGWDKKNEKDKAMIEGIYLLSQNDVNVKGSFRIQMKDRGLNVPIVM
jgi:hypothetical protein